MKKHAGGVVSFFPLEGDRGGDQIRPLSRRFKAATDVAARRSGPGDGGRPAEQAAEWYKHTDHITDNPDRLYKKGYNAKIRILINS